VAIARALVGMPEILLADEPTGNLDTENSWQIMKVFESLNEKHGQTILMITHNPEIAARADRTIHMRDGRIVNVEEDD
jgi:putative ABC transport system ATP-binding protein